MEEKRIFGNRYQVTEKIGMGGMAEVFRASDATLGRTVAIKVMLPQYAADKTFAARFRQEAQAAANLTSPYIVNIYDWGCDDGQYYIVMEYVRGTDLKSAIQQRGAIHPRKVAEIGSQVCSALSIAHSYNIIHRDIKSANIMVQADGNVKVMDFGIAQAGNSDMTQDSSVLGTAHYVSPEQAQGKQLTGASDLYSLGIVMYEACTGRLPFEGQDAVSVALKQVNEAPVSPRQYNENIDPALDAIIMRALQKEPSARYATANEMRQALEDYLAGRSASATTVIPNVTTNDATRVMKPVDEPHRHSAPPTDPYRDTDDHSEPKSKKRKIIIAIVVVLVLAAIGIGVASCNGAFAQKVIIPNVTGMTQTEATAELEKYGFTVGDVTMKASDSVDEGLVISQDPDANEAGVSGDAIDLVISSGPEAPKTTQVPDLKGLTKSEAENILGANNLSGVCKEGYSNKYPEGEIYKQDPAADSEIEEGKSVTYYVSKGKQMATVTNVVGWDGSSAESELKNDGFSVTTSYSNTSDSSQDGTVYRQSISGGSSVEYGSSITIYVYKYVAPATPDEDTDDDDDSGANATADDADV